MSSPPNANTPSTGLAPVSPPAIPSLDNTYGAMMLGTFGGFVLYGLIIHQVFRYVRLPSYKTDASYVKVLVFVVLLLETIHSILSMHSCYYYSITNYTNPEALFHGTWSINLLPMSTGIAVVVSQSFFAYRLFKFNRRYTPIVALAVILLLGELGLSIAMTVQAFVQPNLADYQKFAWMLGGTMRGMIVAADGILTVMLTILLYRSRTGFRSTDSMLNVLILYTINTGLLTGTTSFISFTLGLAFPHTLIGDGMSLCTAKLYANSMLAVLNSRDFLSNYCTAKTGHGATPSKISPIHRSALGIYTSTWPSPAPEGGFPIPSSSPAVSPDVLTFQPHTPSCHVLHIRPTGNDSGTRRDIPGDGDDSVDRKSELSLELRQLRGSSKPAAASHHES